MGTLFDSWALTVDWSVELERGQFVKARVVMWHKPTASVQRENTVVMWKNLLSMSTRRIDCIMERINHDMSISGKVPLRVLRWNQQVHVTSSLCWFYGPKKSNNLWFYRHLLWKSDVVCAYYGRWHLVLLLFAQSRSRGGRDLKIEISRRKGPSDNVSSLYMWCYLLPC